MKPISTILQILALATCFAVQFHPDSATGMPGTRKALQTLEVFTSQPAGGLAVQTVALSDPR